ncbi:pyridoxamine 5'-phosphate oxidase [Rhodohalobacter sp. 8-1]|uniref:pyridoxamine 5'-phosphate oxidase n=1 Tax=Rhodohalobacter sp. 8-1 TaxID=3131972 RepID=UPI0030EC7691
MSIDIAGLRENYTQGGLREDDIPRDPIILFRRWVEEAVKSEIAEPNAMSLATVSEDGLPNSRIVLLKGIENRSIRFFTNYKSSKGRDLEKNPVAAVCFWWPELERQVRIRGSVNKLSREESDAYFQSRPRESKLGAWASEQSSAVENREKLRKTYESISKRFKNTTIPTPEFWGGYEVTISEIEFWQGRPSRLHDRILFIFEQNKWNHKRLQP